MPLISTDDIAYWAASVAAQYEFPGLIRRLIQRTCSDISYLYMPEGKQVCWSGVDGEVECSKGNLYVPKGKSIWEMSCEENCKSKANKDYGKRTPEATTTFTFATPRGWQQAKEWAEEKRQNDCGWGDVRALQAGEIAAWLEMSTVTAVDFLKQQLGRGIKGFYFLEQFWQRYKLPIPGVSLPAKFVIANRDKESEILLDWIFNTNLEDNLILNIQIYSYDEAIDYLAAVFFRKSELGESLKHRIMVINSPDICDEIRGISSCDIIVTTLSIARRIMDIQESTKCRLIIIRDEQTYKNHLIHHRSRLLKIPPIEINYMRRTLIEMEYQEEAIAKLLDINPLNYTGVISRLG